MCLLTKDMSANIQLLRVKLDWQDQYTSKNSLIIHCLQESRNENTNQRVVEALKEKISEEIAGENHDQVHRLVIPKEGKVNPIIVKIARYSSRKRISRNKYIKRKQDSITESLTKNQMEALNTDNEPLSFYFELTFCCEQTKKTNVSIFLLLWPHYYIYILNNKTHLHYFSYVSYY